MPALFEKHRPLLEQAIAAARSRANWSAYPESQSPKIYGEDAKANADNAFEALKGKPFDLPGHPGGKHVGGEVSPYGFALGVTYPQAEVDVLVAASKAAGAKWGAASPEERAGVLLEIIARINRASFLMAHAVMHTSGQAYSMAFQAGGPHAQDRALEAVAYAFDEMSRVPGAVRWSKQTGKDQVTTLDKTFRIVPRGVALVIGCATFPTWNTYPGMFASLATGNTVIVKPHPGAILPLALTLGIAREALAEAGFDPNVVLLAPDTIDRPLTKELALHPGIGIIDFTGSPVFGAWVRENAKGKLVYTEEAGLNSIVIASTDNFRAMATNIAFSLTLYSGQMCTAPQNIFVPAGGIETDQGHKSFDEVADAIKSGIDKLLADPDRASAFLGAVQSEATAQRVKEAAKLGRVVRSSDSPVYSAAPGARTASPIILAVDAADEPAYMAERFGPISFVIAVRDGGDGIARAAAAARQHGAISAALYATDEATIDRAIGAFAEAGVTLSINLTGGVFVNQNAAFSDFHVTGANPAGNACLTDAAFVSNRFRVVGTKRQVAA
ncbi:MAG TPA: phenylacetic acid degradation protein PaaN [Beijerinckiaceae bacterium]|nr:phenylacetic acid degradation protein PaaN [Beijerinckiaceae bacterium]